MPKTPKLLAVIITAVTILAFAISLASSFSHYGEGSANSQQMSTSANSPSAASSPANDNKGGVQVLNVQAYKEAATPSNDAVLSVPPGWSLSADSQATNITITQDGQSEIKIYIYGGLQVSDIGYIQGLDSCMQQYGGSLGAQPSIDCIANQALQKQLSDASHEWSPSEALSALLKFEQSVNPGVTFGTPEVTPINASFGEYVFSFTTNGQTLESFGLISLVYTQNPLLQQPNGEPGISSIAFLAGCESPQDQVQNFQPTCERVLDSFRPSQVWYGEISKQAIQFYEQETQFLQKEAELYAQESQMISQFASQTNQMQQQLIDEIEQSNYYVGQQWIATLGGETNMVDQNGNVYMLPSGYSSYCESGDGTILGGSGLVPGQSYETSSGSFECQTVLSPWQAPSS